MMTTAAGGFAVAATTAVGARAKCTSTTESRVHHWIVCCGSEQEMEFLGLRREARRDSSEVHETFKRHGTYIPLCCQRLARLHRSTACKQSFDKTPTCSRCRRDRIKIRRKVAILEVRNTKTTATTATTTTIPMTNLNAFRSKSGWSNASTGHGSPVHNPQAASPRCSLNVLSNSMA